MATHVKRGRCRILDDVEQKCNTCKNASILILPGSGFRLMTSHKNEGAGTCLTNEREARSIRRVYLHVGHLWIRFGCGVPYCLRRAASIAVTLARRIAGAKISTIATSNKTIAMLVALLLLVSWALLRRRPPPAGAAFGRKFADNLFYLPQLLLLLWR